MPKYLLPKPHLSWSQFTCWKSNQERYIREYMLNGEKLDTNALRFGKSIASDIEEGKFQEKIPTLTVYSEIEYEIRTDCEGVPILSYLDTYDPILNMFREYKTGKVKWTNTKVQKHDQLTFYALAIKLKHGTMPESCTLDWLVTKHKKAKKPGGLHNSSETIALTGEIHSFVRYFDERELDRMQKEIVRTAQEITEAYRRLISEI